jgi:glutamate--cysteine ligase
VALPDGSELVVEPLLRTRGRVGLKDFDPCTILLNNDLSGGVPRALEHLHEQYLLPPLHAGWPIRRKSRHFKSYEEVAKKFAKLLGMDPWLINPMYAQCGKVDFSQPAGLECVRSNVEVMLAKIRRKYKEYGINEKPFVVIKADNATGIGILAVRDVKELDDPERLARARTGLVREGQELDEVIIQEGVPSYERINEAVAEPVVVMIDRYVVGGFYRVHADRGVDENLSAPGSRYLPLAFAGSSQLPKPGAKPGASAPNRFYMYGVIGRLAMLAAAYELEATDPEAESYD